MSHEKGVGVRLYLASTSPARLATLRAAGIEPEVIPSHVDEEAAVENAEKDLGRPLSPSEMVQLLARAKAEAILSEHIDGIVVGGDSAFVLDDTIYGKPLTPEVARQRWRDQRGRTGTLYSGHWVIDHRQGSTHAALGDVTSAEVTFAPDISDAEIDAYVDSGEPLHVAGAFTIDAKGSAFISDISGDPSTVIGISIPRLRMLVGSLGVFWPDLWSP